MDKHGFVGKFQFAIGLLLCCLNAGAAEPTRITIHDEVLVADVRPFGINLGANDSPGNLSLRYRPVEENFEGGLYRRIVTVREATAGEPVAVRNLRERWIPAFRQGTYVVISGASKWTEGKVVAIESEGNDSDARLVLDPPPSVAPEDGILLQAVVEGEGSGAAPELLQAGDVPPDAFGSVALRLPHGDPEAVYRCGIGDQRFGDHNLAWRVTFRAKAAGENGSVRLVPNYGESQAVSLTSDWALYERSVLVQGAPRNPVGHEPVPCTIEFRAEGADVLLDDLVIARPGQDHPSGFRSETIAAYRRLGPGVLRILQGSDNTVRNTILPPLQARNGKGGLHRLYALCEAVGAEAYYCLPSTLTREEMTGFMEYLGAPADVGWGSLRAELGHPAPWTETLPGIVIEFGNELYNFGGYGGPDYWHDLIETGKASPWMRPNVRFVMGHQGAALEHARNADGHATGGYICWGFPDEDHEAWLDTDEKLFHWAMAFAVESVRRPEGELQQTSRAARDLGLEMVLYEGNYHTNFGNGPNAPRNRLVTSIGGGINYVNKMLYQVPALGMRRQCFFQTVGFGHQFKGSAFGSPEAGFVRMWGAALNLDAGSERFRPVWYALEAANRAAAGDLLRTTHEGPDPVFSSTAVFYWKLGQLRRGPRPDPETVENVPELYSYAFRDGARRGLLLVNLGLTEARPVNLEFDGGVRDGTVRSWLLASDHFADDNEPEHPPRVALQERTLEDFRSGCSLTIPPCSLWALQWEEGE